MEENSKRIAKNTIYLYLRLLVSTIIGLYTSRIILNTLGVEDFGIYNVVGGIVSILATFNSTMSVASFRFMNMALGRNDTEFLKTVFNSSLIIHFFIALIILLLAESLGLWFVLEKIVIPEERMTAALWAYQFSILTCMLIIISSPYNNCLLVHEKMDAYAVFSIIEYSLKLVIVFMLGIGGFDKLIEYAILFFLVQLLMRLIYGVYCSRHFQETHFKWKYDRTNVRKMLSFTGWNFIGILSNIGYAEGLNIILNLFFGPVVNAARAIMVQVESKVLLLGRNVQEAVNPQIMKSYAVGNLEYMHELIINSSRYSFYLLFIVLLPLFLQLDSVLHWWLGIIPDNTVVFIKLIFICIILNTLQNTLSTSIYATAKVKLYNIISAIILLTILPVSYILLSNHLEAYSVFIVQIFCMLFHLIVTLVFTSQLISLSWERYTKEVILNILLIMTVSIPVPYIINEMLPSNIYSFILVCIVSLLSTLSSIFFLGLKSKERLLVVDKMKCFCRD